MASLLITSKPTLYVEKSIVSFIDLAVTTQTLLMSPYLNFSKIISICYANMAFEKAFERNFKAFKTNGGNYVMQVINFNYTFDG